VGEKRKGERGGGGEFNSRAEMKDEGMGGREAGRGRAKERKREREGQRDETAQIDIERGGIKRK